MKIQIFPTLWVLLAPLTIQAQDTRASFEQIPQIAVTLSLRRPDKAAPFPVTCRRALAHAISSADHGHAGLSEAHRLHEVATGMKYY